MEDNEMINDTEKLFLELMQLFIGKGYNVGTIYFILGSMFCRMGQVKNLSINQMLADIEVSFAAIPPPIEENDEPNQ